MAIQCPSIETALERLAESDSNAEGFLAKYTTLKDYLATEYYPWIQTNCPYFTDHGSLHVESTIEAVRQILLPSSKNQEKIQALDYYLLLCAIIWHDVGMVYDRSGHAKQVFSMIEKINSQEIFFDLTVQRLVSELVNGNGSIEGLQMCMREQDCSIKTKTYTIYPRALAAIVRFADEIAENRSRISSAILKEGKIPEENKIYWDYANCVVASRADPLRERVLVTIEIEADKAIAKYRCPKECNKYSGGDGSISLIEYVISRLQKMNNERAYCGREFEMYASIRQIVVRLMLTQNGERIKDYTNEVELYDSGIYQSTYPEIEFFEDFFKNKPHWHPHKIEELRKK